MIIGIDLGTTNSAAAYLTPEGPKLIRNALGEFLTPSVVGIDTDGQVLVGRAAKELQVRHPERCASLFKRYMGSDRVTRLGKQDFSPEMLSSLVLQSLKHDAENHFGENIESAVITVPAYFNEPQRRATINAGRMAGLKVERILNEPTAAALVYGFHQQDQEKVLMVVDLGGGTFDVSIVDMFEGALEVKASSGESFLGGEDVTRAMAARILSSRGIVFERAEAEAPAMVSRLVQQCELAKCQLAKSTQASVRLPDKAGNLAEADDAFILDQQQLAEWSQHILARIELPIRRALGDARLKPADLSDVILVGGATRMSAFVDRVRHLLQREPQCSLNPDEVVALGAAVQAGLIGSDESVADLVVTDVAPFTLGVEVTKRLGGQHRDGYFMPIIHRNTTIPVSRVERVSTLEPNQTKVEVKVYQGESRRTEDNLLLGEFEVRNIPPGPAGQDIDLRFTYDLNGVLEVEATIVKTGKIVTHVISRHARQLSDRELADAVTAMQALKVHPREEAANRFALRKAERMYQELPALERQHLASLLDGFESAMEGGDKALIEEHRRNLEEFLGHFENGFDAPEQGDEE